MLIGGFDVLSRMKAVQSSFFEVATTRAEPTKVPVFHCTSSGMLGSWAVAKCRLSPG